MFTSQDADDLELGRLVRAIYHRAHYLSLEDLLDGGCAAHHGYERTRTDGEDCKDCPALDAAVSGVAHKIGIMGKAKTLPPRNEMPTVTEVHIANEDRAMLADKFSRARGKP